MLLTLIACFGSEEPQTEVCEDGWERPIGECPEGEGDADTDTDSDTDTDTGPDGDCEAEADEVSPASGAAGVSVLTTVHIWLSEPVSEGDLRLEGVEGELVWGEGEDWMSFHPSEPLEPSTEYEAVAEACGERMAVWRFTTGEDGATDPGELVGTTWQVNLVDGRVVEPAGVGSVLESYIEGTLLVEVAEQSATELVLRSALADSSGTQDLCQPTDELRFAYSAPIFRYGPADTSLAMGRAEVGDLEIAGVVSADGSALSGVSASGLVDTRPLVPLLDAGDDEDSVCQLMAGFGVSCESCPDGTEFCIRVTLEDLHASQVTEPIVPLETCDASCPEEDCGQCSCASGVGLRGGWLVALFALAGLSRRRRGDTPRA